jgi:hypothetical protein
MRSSWNSSGVRAERNGRTRFSSLLLDALAGWTGRPEVSTLNAVDGEITSNMAIVGTGDGEIDAYATGLTNLILDIFGYFAP